MRQERTVVVCGRYVKCCFNFFESINIVSPLVIETSRTLCSCGFECFTTFFPPNVETKKFSIFKGEEGKDGPSSQCKKVHQTQCKTAPNRESERRLAENRDARKESAFSHEKRLLTNRHLFSYRGNCLIQKSACASKRDKREKKRTRRRK